jgi:hypothetical protein
MRRVRSGEYIGFSVVIGNFWFRYRFWFRPKFRSKIKSKTEILVDLSAGHLLIEKKKKFQHIVIIFLKYFLAQNGCHFELQTDNQKTAHCVKKIGFNVISFGI